LPNYTLNLKGVNAFIRLVKPLPNVQIGFNPSHAEQATEDVHSLQLEELEPISNLAFS